MQHIHKAPTHYFSCPSGSVITTKLPSPHPLSKDKILSYHFWLFLDQELCFISTNANNAFSKLNGICCQLNGAEILCGEQETAGPKRKKSDKEKISQWTGWLENKIHSSGTYPPMSMKLNPLSLIFAASFFALLPVFTELATQNAGKNGHSSSWDTLSPNKPKFITPSLPSLHSWIYYLHVLTVEPQRLAAMPNFATMCSSTLLYIYLCKCTFLHTWTWLLNTAHTVNFNGFWTGSIIENAPTTIQLQYIALAASALYTHYTIPRKMDLPQKTRKIVPQAEKVL